MSETINKGAGFPNRRFSSGVYSLFIFIISTLSLSISQQNKNQEYFTNNCLNQINLTSDRVFTL
jgi:hypothetical protein